MTIRVALNHKTRYQFDRPVGISPHEVRLRPAAHCRTPILSYSLKVKPVDHFINWQQDPYGNYVARMVFPKPSKELEVVVDLIADMTVINPFDFFIEKDAEYFPFEYTEHLHKELVPFLETDEAGPQFQDLINEIRRTMPKKLTTTDFLVFVNQKLHEKISYTVRMDPGVQSCEETLKLASGSCRDSGWLLVHILRYFGIAARFSSGYLIQLVADVKALDGPSGTEHDFTDLHAWAEAYIPGAGWIGLDPTSGLFAGEGHIPLACTAAPISAAPITGLVDVCEATMDFSMHVTRIHEDPRVTKPYTEKVWKAIDTLGNKVDAQLSASDVRLTMGGEPTFVSIDDMEGEEWNLSALGKEKRKRAGILLHKLKERFAPNGLLHFGQGKWYPGEPLPRWALGCYWRLDGKSIWNNPELIADEYKDYGYGADEAKQFIEALAVRLGLDSSFALPAYEDVWHYLMEEKRLPLNIQPLHQDLATTEGRSRLAALLVQGLGKEAGYVLPLKAGKARKSGWVSSPWPLKREQIFLLPGDSSIGYRLPLSELPWVAPKDREVEYPRDPFDEHPPLDDDAKKPKPIKSSKKKSSIEIIHTALCIEARSGRLHVFMPPLTRIEDYLALVKEIEKTAAELSMPLWLEGYPPPRDARIKSFQVTPDPGVIEVNIHPASSWDELVTNTTILYEEARLARLGTEKFMIDGRHAGTGGGNHVTLGGITPADSPMLRRPDLLRSLITYWQNHPALSYLFSGLFVGPTSQSPRVDEARTDSLYELEIAFEQMEEKLKEGEESLTPWLVDRLLRNLLVDLTGNTHRAEFSIDKLYSPDSATGRLGLVEFRAFEMPPHSRMSLVQMLLLRTLVARFWKKPYKGRLVHWDTELHDRFLLPHFIAQDIHDVVRDLQASGYKFESEWLAPFLEFRFPRLGVVVYDGIQLELRTAIEPWNVLGEEVTAGATSRYVDSSLERLQVKVNNLTDTRHAITCNGRPVPLHPTGVKGEYVAGVRYRAWSPPSALHPTIAVHTPLVFDIVDSWAGRSIGGCTYHVSHPGGRNYETFPVNANEAEARRNARFWDHGHTPGKMKVKPENLNHNFPFTLDLRRRPDIPSG